MKIIFLDIDGVLNTYRSYLATGSQETWDMVACKFLQNLLTLNTDIKIVVTSTWRYSDDCLMHFEYNGFVKSMFHKHWRTLSHQQFKDYEEYKNKSFSERFERGREIDNWLNNPEHSDVTHYCIIDDDNDMLPKQQKHFVYIMAENGISDNNMEKILEILDIPVSNYIHKIEHIVEPIHDGYYSLKYSDNKKEYKYI